MAGGGGVFRANKKNLGYATAQCHALVVSRPLARFFLILMSGCANDITVISATHGSYHMVLDWVSQFVRSDS